MLFYLKDSYSGQTTDYLEVFVGFLNEISTIAPENGSKLLNCSSFSFIITI